MFRKSMLFMVVLGLVSCGGQAPIDKYAAADKVAYDCANTLRDAAFAWKTDNPGAESYPSINVLMDETNMPKYNTTSCNNPDLTTAGASEKSFNYLVAHANGKKVYMATPEGVTFTLKL